VLGVETWIRDHGHELVPPIANKLVHKGALLSAMMVGGPNARQDFHCELGPEFFLQLRGDMELITVLHKRRTPVPIRQGYAFVFVLCWRAPQGTDRPLQGICCRRACSIHRKGPTLARWVWCSSASATSASWTR